MKNFQSLKKEELKSLYESLSCEYKAYQGRGLSLDISRGKPNSEQIDVSQAILSTPLFREDCFTKAGMDARNYGEGTPDINSLYRMAYLLLGTAAIALLVDFLLLRKKEDE